MHSVNNQVKKEGVRRCDPLIYHEMRLSIVAYLTIRLKKYCPYFVICSVASNIPQISIQNFNGFVIRYPRSDEYNFAPWSAYPDKFTY